MMPAVVAMISDGIWLTRPSPTVKMEYARTASPMDIPLIFPMTIPPIRFTAVMMSPAMASPRTNLVAPSIAP